MYMKRKMNNQRVARHELKFYINYKDYQYSKYVLDQLMNRDTYQKKDEGYFIRSMYFDDIYDTSVEEKLAGVEKRDKYRLRIYEFNQNWAKLERKRKVNNYVEKDTIILTREDAYNTIGGRYQKLLDTGDPNAETIYFDLKRSYKKPVVIIDYLRDAYMLDYNNIRITFDKNIRYNDTDLDIYNPDLTTIPIQKEHIIIMEIKFNNFLPDWFVKQLTLDSATYSAISKYCQSRLKTTEYYFN